MLASLKTLLLSGNALAVSRSDATKTGSCTNTRDPLMTLRWAAKPVCVLKTHTGRSTIRCSEVGLAGLITSRGKKTD